MKEFGAIVLSAKDYAALMENLENPPAPNAALKRAAARHKKFNANQGKAVR
jgi:uncharacterized protein (DUF1778 family)